VFVSVCVLCLCTCSQPADFVCCCVHLPADLVLDALWSVCVVCSHVECIAVFSVRGVDCFVWAARIATNGPDRRWFLNHMAP
jgi:hypothetical protein